VTNAIIMKVAVIGLPPERVGQPQVGMAYHSPHVLDAPVDHRLRHEVRHGAHMGWFVHQPHVDAIVANLDWIGGHAIAIPTRRFSCRGMEIPAVPRTTQHSFLDGPFSQRTRLVGALVA